MMVMHKCSVLAILALALSGCASLTGKSVSNIHEIGLERAAVQPPKDWIEGARVKVVISPTEGKEWPMVQQAMLLPLFAQAVEKSVEESGSEVVDRSLNTSLRDEMRLAEAKGSGNFEGPAAAHFVVKPAFTKVTVNSPREVPGMLSNLLTKKGPPVYNHALEVEGRIRIYEIPSMRLIETLQIKEEQKEDNTSPHLADTEVRLRQAFERAYERVRSDFKNLIAPRGAVVKKGLTDSGTVFQIMIGSDHKVKPRDKVKVFSLGGGAETQIAEGVVTGDVAQRNCWISIEDPKSAARLREGDMARLVIEDGWLGKLKPW
jgi:hypothetical protein